MLEDSKQSAAQSLYIFLRGLRATDDFWLDNKFLDGYSKQMCLKDYITAPRERDNAECFNQWYSEQKEIWETNNLNPMRKYVRLNSKTKNQ